jgi:hypothetical protein
MKRAFLSFIVFILFLQDASAIDTVRVLPAALDVGLLSSGTRTYLVYFKKGKDSSRISQSIWSRKTERLIYNGRQALAVTQRWDASDGGYHTAYSVCDSKTFEPLFHRVWWRNRGTTTFDFIKREAFMNDTLLTGTESDRKKRAIKAGFDQTAGKYFLNWHLDMETLGVLPAKSGKVFLLDFYEPGFGGPAPQTYAVVGTDAILNNTGGRIDCWLLENKDGKTISHFWISKKTHDVLKVEDNTNGVYRYKLLLAYTD